MISYLEKNYLEINLAYYEQKLYTGNHETAERE
jgi:hypothetical protein